MYVQTRKPATASLHAQSYSLFSRSSDQVFSADPFSVVWDQVVAWCLKPSIAPEKILDLSALAALKRDRLDCALALL